YGVVSRGQALSVGMSDEMIARRVAQWTVDKARQWRLRLRFRAPEMGTPTRRSRVEPTPGCPGWSFGGRTARLRGRQSEPTRDPRPDQRQRAFLSGEAHSRALFRRSRHDSHR